MTGRKTEYTYSQDVAILSASRGDDARLAEKFGRSVGAIRSRRQSLREGASKGEGGGGVSSFSPRFARPKFFQEDLGALISPRSTVGRVASYAKE